MSNHNIRVDAIGLAAEVVELRNEIARLKNQTNWVCQCGGTDCDGQRENAELKATLDAVIAADERAVELWRVAHPGSELVIPDRGKLVGWLLEQDAELRAHAERVGQANDRLAIENAALRKAKEMVELERCEMMRSMSLAQNQSEQLRKDKERLDWIFWPSCSRKARARMLKLIGTPGYRSNQGGMLAWRVAIDEARKEAQP